MSVPNWSALYPIWEQRNGYIKAFCCRSTIRLYNHICAAYRITVKLRHSLSITLISHLTSFFPSLEVISLGTPTWGNTRNLWTHSRTRGCIPLKHLYACKKTNVCKHKLLANTPRNGQVCTEDWIRPPFNGYLSIMDKGACPYMNF